MAATTKPEINKSEVIRAYFRQNPTALAKEVVTALGEKGVSVTESHVYVVKGKMKLTKRRQAKAKAAANGTPAPVKKTTSPDAPNKSQSIRETYNENPTASVDEVISILAAKGISVKKGLVYLVKGKMRSRKRRQARAKVAAEMATTTAVSKNGSADALTTIKQIKGLAAELGGMKKLKALVEALSD